MNRSSLLLLIAELAPDAPLNPTQVLVAWMLLMITGTRPGSLGNLNGARVGPFPVLGMVVRKGKGGPYAVASGNTVPPSFPVIIHGPAAKTQAAFIDEYNAPAGLANVGPLFYVNANKPIMQLVLIWLVG